MRSLAILSLLPLALAAPATRGQLAPLLIPQGVSELIADHFIVKLKDGSASASLDETIGLLSASAEHVYLGKGFRGFAGKLNHTGLELTRAHPDVDFIEQDAVVSIATYVEQSNAPWSLSRLSRLSYQSAESTTYSYHESAGEGTCSYVIDSGIYTENSDFGGRATNLATFVGSSETDDNGHGTHIAGIVGSNTYGVAKKTSLFGVKVLNDRGLGTSSGVIAGMNFVTEDAQTRECPNGKIVSMSLIGRKSSAVNSAAAALISGGIFLAVAAGNHGGDAADYSPASETTACTVGATDTSDSVASYSNWGRVVDIFAPGSDIASTWIGENNATNVLSGTSMASGHIAGLAAYLSALEGSSSPLALCARIQELAVHDILSSVNRGNDNLLPFSGEL